MRFDRFRAHGEHIGDLRIGQSGRHQPQHLLFTSGGFCCGKCVGGLTGSAVPVDGRVRIGSNTKTFTAVVVLQLVGEGKVELDKSVEKYLPGLVRGVGVGDKKVDGREITVRELLQHTSGIPEYGEYIDDDIIRRRYAQPRDLLDIALQHPATARPGTEWSYSNTDYILAGMIIEKITGRPLAEEITRRIIGPLKLRTRTFPPPAT